MLKSIFRKSFFTLIELLSAIAIIAILAAIVLGGLNYASRRADEAKTLSAMKQLELALDAFRQDRGYFPPTDGNSGIKVQFLLVSDEVMLRLDGKDYSFFNTSSKRPYLELGEISSDSTKPTDFIDAWGNAFLYRCPGLNNPSSYDLWSLGVKTGTDEDDIANWKRN